MKAALHELQTRVRATELRVVAHDAALRRRLDMARSGCQHHLRQARRWLPLAAAAAMAGGAGWWLLRPRTAPSRPRAASIPRSRAATQWLRTVGLLWPMLPVRWRARLSPTTAAVLAVVGPPLLEGLLSDGRSPPDTAPDVDLQRYAGTWHEIARLPARFERHCVGQPTDHYALHGGGLHITHRCCGDDGREQRAVGEARVVADSGNARLEVSFMPALLRALPFAWADHWILHVDADYRFAVVGDPARRHCWLLAREPRPTPDEREHLVQIAAARGYAVERLIHHTARRDPEVNPSP
jgi:apolipoprotein D and lipocalin family protein